MRKRDKLKNAMELLRQDVLKAKQLNDGLHAENQRMGKMYAECLCYFTALIQIHHGGRVTLPIDGILAMQGKQLDEQLHQALRMVTLTVVDSGLKVLSRKKTDSQAGPPLLPAAPAKEQMPDLPGAACDNSWHSDPNRVGFACPQCGSTVRLEEEARSTHDLRAH